MDIRQVVAAGAVAGLFAFLAVLQPAEEAPPAQADPSAVVIAR